MRKNSLLLSIFTVLSLVLPSCSGGKSRVAFFYYNGADSFIKELSYNLDRLFKDKFLIKSYDSENSQSTQNGQIVYEFQENKPNLMIVNICDRFSASTIIEKAKKYNTPIIFINREPLISDVQKEQNIYYVGTDPIYEGVAQGSIANECFGGPDKFKMSSFDKNGDGKLQVYLIKGEQGHQDTELRSKHSISQLINYGYDVEIIHTVGADWNREKASLEFSKSYNELLDEKEKTKIELILSNNDDMALGVVDYLKTLQDYDSDSTIVDQYFPIVSVDGIDSAISAIENGFIYGTVKNNSVGQADAIYKLATRLINHETFDDFEYKFDNGRFIHIEGEKITEKNVKQYKENL